MTQWELAACIDGYNRAHGGDDQPPPHMASAEVDDLVEKHRNILGKVLH